MYFTLTDQSKREYSSRIMGEIHGWLVSPMSFYVCFYTCDDPTQSIFSSDECVMTPKRIQLYIMAFSGSFITYDLFICLFELKYTLSKGGDFIAHHFVSIFGLIFILVAGRFSVALGCA